MTAAIQRNSIRGWVVCLVAALLAFYVFVQLMMFNAISQSLMRTFSITATEVGLISSCYLIANLIFIFPAGVALDRISTRKLITASMLLCLAGTVGFAFSASIYQAMAAHYITGIGGALPFLACLRLASRWIPPRHTALVSGLIVTIMMLGGVTGQTPVTILVSRLGWRQALLVNAAVGALFLLLILLVVRDFPPNYPRQARLMRSFSYQDLLHTLKVVARRPANWLLGVYTSLLNLPIMLLGAVWGVLFLTQQQHLTTQHASYVTSMIFFGTIVGAPVVGWFSDRLGRRKLPMILFAVLSILVVLAIMYLPHLSFSMLIVLFFLLGFVTSAQILTYPAIAENNDSSQGGAALGVASSIIMGGAGFFQPLFGRLMDLGWDGKLVNGIAYYSSANYHSGFLIFPITLVIALIVVLFFKETIVNEGMAETEEPDQQIAMSRAQ